MQEPRIWQRGSRGWYVTIDRQQIPLGRDEAEAKKKYHELLAGQKRLSKQGLTVRALYDQFIAWMQRQPKYKPKTIQHYRDLCGRFVEYFPGKVSRLKPKDLEDWIASKSWSQGTRSTAYRAVIRLFNWAVRHKLIPENILRDAESEPMVRREHVLSVEQQDYIEETAGPGLREFLIALRDTGARPGTIASVTAKEIVFEEGLWRVPEHKTKHKTGQAIVVAMTPRLARISRVLCTQHPAGPIFRTVNGKPWTHARVTQTFKRIKDRTGYGAECYAYAYRHRFITEALRRGVDPVTVATLVGHKGMDMIKRFYAHYDAQQLQDAVLKATCRDPSATL